MKRQAPTRRRGNRIRELMNREDIGGFRGLSERTGIHWTHLADVARGDFEPTTRVMDAFEDAFPNYSRDWLWPRRQAEVA